MAQEPARHLLEPSTKERPSAAKFLRIIESSVLGLETDSSEDFTPLQRGDQGFLGSGRPPVPGRRGEATGTPIEDTEMDSIEEMRSFDLPPIFRGAVAGQIRLRDELVDR